MIYTYADSDANEVMYICADADAYEAEAFHMGSCTYYVITDRGGSLQMITVLHGGGPPNDYIIT